MSSKKSSQAQPRPLQPPSPLGSGHRTEDPLEDRSAARLANASPASPAPSRFPAEPPATPRRFTCPAWPPPLPQLAADLSELLASGDWGRYQSESIERLGALMQQDLGVSHVRLTCSGSAAMELALRACGFGGGASGPAPEVICPALDYPGNVRAVRLLGAMPVLVDTLADRWTIDPEAVLAAATPQTTAVIASHLYGDVARVDILREICDRRGWHLLEDVCQMPGGRIGDRPLGSFGHVATWSFGGSKPLTAGCGGAITTDDDRIAQRLAAHADRPSDAFPLSPLQAAVLIPQWTALDQFAARQRARLTQLAAACRDRTEHWRWPTCGSPEDRPVSYKVPLVLAAGTSEVIQSEIICSANERGIPAGEPFRIPERMARSRGRIVSSDNARAIAAKTWLIDHRALAGDEANVDDLADVLIDLHDCWSQRAEIADRLR